jgi:spore coat polysaccharide biosynthesis protein SpsF (cytidylyltransferase family)
MELIAKLNNSNNQISILTNSFYPNFCLVKFFVIVKYSVINGSLEDIFDSFLCVSTTKNCHSVIIRVVYDPTPSKQLC